LQSPSNDRYEPEPERFTAERHSSSIYRWWWWWWCLRCMYIPPLVAEFGSVAAGPPAFELPPAVLPEFCASANVLLVRARRPARAITLSFILVVSSWLVAKR
jgi:hypothetical protein